VSFHAKPKLLSPAAVFAPGGLTVGEKTMSGGEALDWGALVSRLVYPTKVWIIEALRWIGEPLSASELEKIFGGSLSVSAISYHVTTLAKLGVLERVDEFQIRGAWKKLYAFSPAVLKSDGLVA
jgi:DNA-binding transcriptional ArsR family regulator